MKTSRPSIKRPFLRKALLFVAALLGCGAWIYHAACLKSLNLQLLAAAQEHRVADVEGCLQHGANPDICVASYPYGDFGQEMRHRFTRDMFSFWGFRYYLLENFTGHKESDAGHPLLFAAAANHDAPLFHALLTHGADVNAISKESEIIRTADTINVIEHEQVTLLMAAARWGDVTALRELLSHHPHINIRDSRGATPLHYAIYWQQTDAVRLLLASGANPNGVDIYQYTPLMNVASSPQGDVVALADLLLRHGTHINQRNKYHKTALTIAKERQNTRLVPFLIARGATE